MHRWWFRTSLSTFVLLIAHVFCVDHYVVQDLQALLATVNSISAAKDLIKWCSSKRFILSSIYLAASDKAQFMLSSSDQNRADDTIHIIRLPRLHAPWLQIKKFVEARRRTNSQHHACNFRVAVSLQSRVFAKCRHINSCHKAFHKVANSFRECHGCLGTEMIGRTGV